MAPHDPPVAAESSSISCGTPPTDSELPAGQLPISRTVRVLSWASFWNDIASEAIYPIVPIFLTETLGGSKLALGWIQGLSESAASLLKLASGVWSDRRGARKVWVLSGYLISAVVRPVLAVVAWPWQLFAVRVADRIGKGLRTAPRDALISESTAPHALAQAFGFHRAMDHLGAALGPLAAAAWLWLWPSQLRALFAATALPGFIVVGLLYFRLREGPVTSTDAVRSAASERASATTQSQKSLHVQPFFWRFLAAVSLFALGNASDAFLLVRLRDAGWPLEAIPLYWFGLHLLKSAGNRWGGYLADRWGPFRSLRIGWLLYAVAFLAFGWAASWWQLLVASAVYAAYFGFAEPAEKAYVVAACGAAGRGVGFGWYHGVTGIAIFPASVLFGWMYETRGAATAYAAAAGLALLALAILPRPGVPAAAPLGSRSPAEENQSSMSRKQ